MKITKIEQQQKTKGRYSIFVDDKFSFGISELGLINCGLKIGQELSDSDLEELKSEAKIDKILNQTLALIMRRPRSQWEIEFYLKKKGIEEQTADSIVESLTEKGFVDDLDFAKRWVENRRLLKSISRRKLELELRQKRVGDDIIKQILSEDQTDEIKVLQNEITKKRQQTRYKDDSKLMQYLIRQGYNYGDVKQAIYELSGGAG